MPREPAEPVALSWPRFRTWFQTAWEPGQHIAIIAPTGAGKTTFAGGILDLRHYVLVLDPKGGDETLGGLDLRRLPTWPGNRKMEELLEQDRKKGRRSHFVVGPVVRTMDDKPKLKKAMADTLVGAFEMEGWTVYVDELQITADRRMLDLSAEVDNLLVAARSKKVSLITSFQMPRWVTSAALTQPTWIVSSYTRDVDTTNRMAELLGRPKAEIRGAMRGLEKYCWVVIGRDPRQPLILTKPDAIAPKRKVS